MRSNRPVNADARASAVLCKGRRAGAGYWERWAVALLTSHGRAKSMTTELAVALIGFVEMRGYWHEYGPDRIIIGGATQWKKRAGSMA